MKRTLLVQLKPYCNCRIYFITTRNTSTSSKRKDKVTTGDCDLVGQPDPISNLRSIKFYVPENENEIERQFRLKREEVQKWNEEFWTNHNRNFIKERKEFIDLHKKESENIDEPISADKLSVFYKKFLDKNWKTHLNYNYEWYKKNAMLIFLGIRVSFNRMIESKFKNS